MTFDLQGHLDELKRIGADLAIQQANARKAFDAINRLRERRDVAMAAINEHVHSVAYSSNSHIHADREGIDGFPDLEWNPTYSTVYPSIRGTELTTSEVVHFVNSGCSWDSIIERKDITRDAIRQSLSWHARNLPDPSVEAAIDAYRLPSESA